jgi:NADH dehydrogenase FAD-containing subunit
VVVVRYKSSLSPHPTLLPNLTPPLATGVEFAAELFDLCHEDLQRMYPTLLPFVKITIYDVAAKILPMFDKNLADYALEHFRRDGIAIKTEHHIQSLVRGLPGIKPGEEAGGCTLTTKEDGEVGVGMCVWSTGLMMNPFIEKALNDVHRYPAGSAILGGEGKGIDGRPEDQHWILKRHEKTGGLIVDSHFRVKLVSSPSVSPSKSKSKPTEQSLASTSVSASSSASSSQAEAEATMRDVFALGDVTVMEKARLPATAQVANQEAKWLGKMLNRDEWELGRGEGFTFRNMGVMTYLGGMRAIMQTGGEGEIKG